MSDRHTQRAFALVTEVEAGLRLDQCLAKLFASLSRRKARELITRGEVWVNGRPVRIMSRPVEEGDRITWLPRVEEEAEESSGRGKRDEDKGARPNRHARVVDWEAYGGRPTFLYRDNYIAVINKPSGIPTEPTPKEDLRTCLRQVEATLHEEGLHPRRVYVAAVHRLDAQASGALAFALRKQAAGELSSQFQSRSAGRLYRALVVGRIPEDEGELRHHLARVGPGLRRGTVPKHRGKLAVTQFSVIERFEDATLVDLRLQTGRTHQIRVQMAEAGFPLIGDWLYTSDTDKERCPPTDRLLLHAHSLTLRHPKTKKAMTFEAPLPDDFAAYLAALAGRPWPEADAAEVVENEADAAEVVENEADAAKVVENEADAAGETREALEE